MRLKQDDRFQGVKVFYDRSRERIVDMSAMPAINVFLEAPWEDIARGSGAYSLQTRKMAVRIGFGVWACGGDPDKMDESLFMMSGYLMDFLRDSVEFDRTAGIFVDAGEPLRWDVDYSGAESDLVGTQKISATFEFFSGTGR